MRIVKYKCLLTAIQMLFEQSQSVISRIQQILREYPFGDAVLLELLQNADDAEATLSHLNLIVPPLTAKHHRSGKKAATAKTLIEKRFGSVSHVTAVSDDVEHAVDAFHHRPVLEFFNNSVFTERDLNNIQSIGGSTDDSKKHDGTKVGRFGLGFNSAYHISDVILFVSDSALIVLDPSRTILPPSKPGEPRSVGGYRWNYVEESHRLEQLLRLASEDTQLSHHAHTAPLLSDKDILFLALMELLETSDAHFFENEMKDGSVDHDAAEEHNAEEGAEEDGEQQCECNEESKEGSVGSGKDDDEEQEQEHEEHEDAEQREGDDDDDDDEGNEEDKKDLESIPSAQHRIPFSRFASYRGTLFRFPLRRASSLLWKECHDTNQIATMMCGFPHMAILGLALTKNVCQFEAFITTPAHSATKTIAPAYKRHPLYCVRSNGWRDEIHEKKVKCVEWLTAYTTAMKNVAAISATDQSRAVAEAQLREAMARLPAPTQVCLRISVQVTHFPSYIGWLRNYGASTGSIDALRGGLSSSCCSSEVFHKTFTVAHQFGPGGGGEKIINHRTSALSQRGTTDTTNVWVSSSVWAIAEECARYAHPISVPWGATIIENERSLTLSRRVKRDEQLRSSNSGVLMCFFPIRASTGLPVHIHGYFQLSSDRQSVVSVDRSKWNSALCTDVIPYSYAAAVEHMCAAFPVESPLHLWPLGAYKDDPTIERIATRTLAELATRPVFPTLTTTQEDGRKAHTYMNVGDVKCFVTTISTPPVPSDAYRSPSGAFGAPVTAVKTAANNRPLLSSVTYATYKLLLQLEQSSRLTRSTGFGVHAPRLLYVGGEQDFSKHLAHIVTAMANRNISIPSVDAAFCRTIIAQALRDQQTCKKILPIPNNILAHSLLNIVLADGDYKAFAAMFSASPHLTSHVLIPLAAGFGSSFVQSVSYRVKTTTFFLAQNQSIFDVACTISPLRERLIYCVQQATPQLLRPSSQAAERVEDSVARHLSMLIDPMRNRSTSQCTVELLTERKFLEQLLHVVSSAAIYYECVALSAMDQDLESSTPLEHEWRLIIVPSGGVVPHEMLLIQGGAQRSIFQWIKTLNLSDYAKLPLLPRRDEEQPHQPQHLLQDVVKRRSCVSPVQEVCIALEPYSPSSGTITTAADSSEAYDDDASQELLGVFHLLTLIGAAPLDTSVLPIEHIYAWNSQRDLIRGQQPISPFLASPADNCFAQGVVAIISASDIGALHAIAVMRKKPVADWGPLLHQEVPAAHDDVAQGEDTTRSTTTYADLVRRFFARHHQRLSREDKQFLATLPLLRTVWPSQFAPRGSLVRSFGKCQYVSDAHQFILPSSIPHEMQDLIRSAPLSDAHVKQMLRGHAAPPLASSSIMSKLTIIARESSDDVTQLVASLFLISELAEFDAATLSACLLGGPIVGEIPPSSRNDKKGVEMLWKYIIGSWKEHLTRPPPQLSKETAELRHALRDFVCHIPMLHKYQPHRNGTNITTTQSAEPTATEPMSEEVPLTSSRLSISTSSIPADVVRLADILGPDAFDHNTLGNDAYCFAHVPDALQAEPLLLEFLGIATKIAGPALLRVSALASDYFANHGVLEDPCSHQAKELLQLSRALLTYLDADHREVSHLKLVPVLASSDARQLKGDSTKRMAFLFGELGDACTTDVFRLCPIGGDISCLHPAVYSNNLEEEDVEDVEETRKTLLQEQFPHLSKVWGSKPRIQNTLEYITTMSGVTSPETLAPHRPSAQDWRAVLAYCNEAASNRKKETGLDDIIRSSFAKGLYSPLREMAVPLEQLSMELNTADCYPILSHITTEESSSLKALWHVLNIPAQHSFETLQHRLLHYSSNEAEGTNSQQIKILRDDLLAAYINVVKHMVNRFPQESRAFCQSAHKDKRLWLPVVNGSLRPGHELFYDISTILTPDSGISAPDEALTLHPGIGMEIARVLDLQHVSVQLVSRMHNAARQRNPSASFRARGQRQKVTDSIKRVLGDYSDKQSVIFEMLQNADDAGAKNVTFYLDTRTFDRSKPEALLGSEMARCQGPSLVVFNDQLFSNADFDALYEIGCGHKAKDPTAIGRFGVGFNSVYRLTDCVSIVSGDTTQFLDPSAAHLGLATEAEPGLTIHHTSEPTLASTFHAQFAPFAFYGVDFTKRFEGTLFRLPLREEVRDDISLCNQAYTPAAVRLLFQGFDTFLPHVLLFLKNIETITFMEVTEDSSHRSPRCELMSRVSIHDFIAGQDPCSCQQVQSLDEKSRVVVRKYREDLLASFHDCKTDSAQGDTHSPTASHRAVVSVSIERNAASEHPNECHTWLLSSVLRSLQDIPPLDCDPGLKKKLLPWGAVALRLDTDARIESSEDTDTSEKGQPFVVDGASSTRLPFYLRPRRTPQSMVHCSLPLPSVKGEYPFHVHGSFALTSDRRGMWTQNLSDQKSWEVVWNQFVLSVAVAEAAVRALELHPSLASADTNAHLDQDTLHTQYFELFPTATQATEGFAMFRTGFYEEAMESHAKLLWSQHVKDDGSDPCDEPEEGRGAFVAVQQACCTMSDSGRSQHQSRNVNLADDIAAHCIPVGQSLCSVPHRVVAELLHALTEGASDATATSENADRFVLSPEVVARELFRRAGASQTHSVVLSTLVKSESRGSTTTPTDATTEETVSDDAEYVVVQIARYVCQVEDKTLLRGVPLVLLEDGTIGIVGKSVVSTSETDRNNDNECIYLDVSTKSGGAVARMLFPQIPVVDRRYRSDMSAFLDDDECCNLLCIERLHVDNLDRVMTWFADPELTGACGRTFVAPHDTTLRLETHPHRVFCTNFWTFVSQSFELQSSLTRMTSLPPPDRTAAHHGLLSWPLIPAQSDGVATLVPISDVSSLVACSNKSLLGTYARKEDDIDRVLTVFELLGVRIVDKTFPLSQTVQKVCSIPDLANKNIAIVLQTALKAKRFLKLKDAERDTLLQWLVDTFINPSNRFRLATYGQLTTDSIAQLPLFPVLLRIDHNTRSTGNPSPQLIYEYQSLPPQTVPTKKNKHPPVIESFAMIPNMPLTFGIGLHKRAINELHIVEMNPVTFLENKVLPVLLSLGITQASRNLQASELISVLKYLAVHIDTKPPQNTGTGKPPVTLRERFRQVHLFPAQRTFNEVRAARGRNVVARTSSPLRQFAAEWLADACYLPHAPSLITGSFTRHSHTTPIPTVTKEAPPAPVVEMDWKEHLRTTFSVHRNRIHLMKMVQDARLAHLDMSLRNLRSVASKVIVCPQYTSLSDDEQVVMSTVEEMLQLCGAGTFSFMILPTLLSEEHSICSVAQKLGAVTSPTESMLVEMATALARHKTTLYPQFARRTEATSSSVSSSSSYRDIIHRLSMNVGKCIVDFSGRRSSSLVKEVEDIAFIVPHAGPGHTVSLTSRGDPPSLVAPKSMVRYEYMWCSWLVRPVMPKELSDLCRSNEPPLDVVIEQLALFVSDKAFCSNPSAFSKQQHELLSHHEINKAISCAYEVLDVLSRKDKNTLAMMARAATATPATTRAAATWLHFALPLRQKPALSSTWEFVDELMREPAAIAVPSTKHKHAKPSPGSSSSAKKSKVPPSATSHQEGDLFTFPTAVHISKIILVDDAQYFGLLHPYFYHEREFEFCKPLHSLIQRIAGAIATRSDRDAKEKSIKSHSKSQARYPPVEDVLRALSDAAEKATPHQPSQQQRRSPCTLHDESLRLYLSLLRLLVASAMFHNVELTWEPLTNVNRLTDDDDRQSEEGEQSSSKGDQSEDDQSRDAQSEGEGDDAAKQSAATGTLPQRHQVHRVVASLYNLLLPNQEGVLVPLISSGICFPDMPSLVRRIRSGAVMFTHPDIFPFIASRLHVPLVSSVIVEVQQHSPDAAQKLTGDAQDTAQQNRVQTFLRSHLFLSVLRRLVRTLRNKQVLQCFRGDGGGGGGVLSHDYGDERRSAEDEISHVLGPHAVSILSQIDVQFVHRISTTLTHREAPDVDVSSAAHTPNWLLLRGGASGNEGPKILVCVDRKVINTTTGTSTAATTSHHGRGRGAKGRAQRRGRPLVPPHQPPQLLIEQQHIPRHYCVALALCELLSQQLSSVIVPMCCVLERVFDTARRPQQQKHQPIRPQSKKAPAVQADYDIEGDEDLHLALHNILDKLDCSGTLSAMRRGAPQLHVDPTAPRVPPSSAIVPGMK